MGVKPDAENLDDDLNVVWNKYIKKQGSADKNHTHKRRFRKRDRGYTETAEKNFQKYAIFAIRAKLPILRFFPLFGLSKSMASSSRLYVLAWKN